MFKPTITPISTVKALAAGLSVLPDPDEEDVVSPVAVPVTPGPVTMATLAHATDGIPLLGYTVWWYVPSNACVKQDAWNQAWNGRGLPKIPANPCTPRAALRAGIEDWLEDRAKAMGSIYGRYSTSTEASQVSLIRVINSAASPETVFVIVIEQRDLAKYGLQHATGLRVFLNKEAGTMWCTVQGSGGVEDVVPEPAIAAEIAQYWGKYTNALVARDVTNALNEALSRVGMVRVKREGGVYFLPANSRPIADELNEFLAAAVPGAYISLLGVPDAGASKVALMRGATDGLLAEINEEARVVARYESEKETVRVKTLAGAMGRITQLRAKVSATASLLEMSKDSLEESLGTLTRRVEDLMLDED
jgi:hypothetical protein